jgi:hypothetical protein
MSWYNRKPRPKNPPAVISPKNSSPAAEKYLKEIKDTVRGENIEVLENLHVKKITCKKNNSVI